MGQNVSNFKVNYVSSTGSPISYIFILSNGTNMEIQATKTIGNNIEHVQMILNSTETALVAKCFPSLLSGGINISTQIDDRANNHPMVMVDGANILTNQLIGAIRNNTPLNTIVGIFKNILTTCQNTGESMDMATMSSRITRLEQMMSGQAPVNSLKVNDLKIGDSWGITQASGELQFYGPVSTASGKPCAFMVVKDQGASQNKAIYLIGADPPGQLSGTNATTCREAGKFV